MSDAELSRLIKENARSIGFDLAGIAPAVVGLGAERLERWLAEGRHGEMDYMQQHADARKDPNRVLAGVRSIIMVGLGYRTVEPALVAPGTARISRYAWGADYHKVVRQRLEQLAERIVADCPDLRWRAAVDSAPLMERDFAELAGLGWIGKNTLLLHRQLGSYFFLGALLVDRTLEYDVPHATQHCGTCTRCLDACPTQAFDGPYRLDPRRCISYLTIEHHSSIPDDLAGRMADWVFGCDVCQDVCPWNRRAPANGPEAFLPRPGSNPVPLCELLELSEDDYRQRFRGTALFRSRRRRVLRNAALVAATTQCDAARPQLEVLTDDPEPLVRVAATSAIRKLDSNQDDLPAAAPPGVVSSP
jgi:epoxyqueuosine reductase